MVEWFYYDGTYLKGGYICNMCGKSVIGKNIVHTKDECFNYRKKASTPDCRGHVGSDKYIKIPDWALLESKTCGTPNETKKRKHWVVELYDAFFVNWRLDESQLSREGDK